MQIFKVLENSYPELPFEKKIESAFKSKFWWQNWLEDAEFYSLFVFCCLETDLSASINACKYIIQACHYFDED